MAGGVFLYLPGRAEKPRAGGPRKEAAQMGTRMTSRQHKALYQAMKSAARARKIKLSAQHDLYKEESPYFSMPSGGRRSSPAAASA